jgi:hypothetical protein
LTAPRNVIAGGGFSLPESNATKVKKAAQKFSRFYENRLMISKNVSILSLFTKQEDSGLFSPKFTTLK